jgi:RimJ/RimL family protein N-acetyltransferase
MVAVISEYEGWLARAGLVRVRRARPEDRDELRDMHSGLSPLSTYLRYFTAGVNVELTLERLLRPADDAHESLVAIVDDEIVAVACYECLEPTTAEIAFLVDDHHHGIGVATVLLSELTRLARSSGVRRFIAITLPCNVAMMSVFRDCGLRYTVTQDADEMHIDITLDDDATPARGWEGIASNVLRHALPTPRTSPLTN